MSDLTPPPAYYCLCDPTRSAFSRMNLIPTPSDEKALWRDMHRLSSPQAVQVNWPRIVIHEMAATQVKTTPGATIVLHYPSEELPYVHPKLVVTVPTSVDPTDPHRSEGSGIVVLTSDDRRKLVVRVHRRLKEKAVPKETRAVVRDVIRSAMEYSRSTATSARSTASSQRDLVARARRLDEKGQTDAALDLVYDAIDEKLRNGEFQDVDSMLAALHVADLSCDLLLGVLTATLPAKSRLPSRRAVLSETESVLKRRGEYEEGLLTGL
jgi:hypothetical protein